VTRDPLLDALPDVRDGLTRKERVVLWQLRLLQEERGGRPVATAQLYGRVTEHVDLSVDELQRILQRLGGLRA
jgi:DNA gyrase/topoisomerase IV subunit A